MKSKIAEALQMKSEPVALIWSDEKPDGAIQLKKKKYGCVINLAAKAAKGGVVVVDKETFGCISGGTALGFGNLYHMIPIDEKYFFRSLTCGNDRKTTDLSIKLKLKLAETLGFAPKNFEKTFYEGEGFKKDIDVFKKYLENLPITKIKERYVIFKPLKMVDENKEKVALVIFFVNPTQLSALCTMSNYDTSDVNRVQIITGAACQTISMFPYTQIGAEKESAIVGSTDLGARRNITKLLGNDILSFTVTRDFFKKMESNYEGSVLTKTLWKELTQSNAETDSIIAG